MARDLAGWVHVTGVLRLTSPLSVGGLVGDPDVDLPLARTVAGDWLIPGSSVAGALRHFAHDAIGETSSRERLLADVFGDIAQPSDGAAALHVHDAIFEASHIEVRDRNGIDRHTGAAAGHILYRRELIATASRARFCLTLELPSDKTRRAERERVLATLIGALGTGEVVLGASTSSGLGRVQLEDVTTTIEPLDRETLLGALRGEGLASHTLPEPFQGAPATTFCLTWKSKAPMMSKAGRDGVAIDGLPLVGRVDDKLIAFVLPGSAIKGRLRSLAEYICRTVARIDTTPDTFLEQLSQLTVVERLFGAATRHERKPWAGRAGTHAGLKPVVAQGRLKHGRSAIDVDDCRLAEMPRDLWEAISNATRSDQGQGLQEVVGKLDANGWGRTSEQRLDIGYHVAIDRWTGAAADQLLFSALEPQLPGPHEFRFRLHPERLGDDGVGRAALFLWLLVLREVTTGSVGFGFGANRGYGAMVVENGVADVTVKGAGNGLTAVLVGVDNLSQVTPEHLASLVDAWGSHCGDTLTPPPDQGDGGGPE